MREATERSWAAVAAHVSTLPALSGDGYSYGGATILTIGTHSILIGEGQIYDDLATEIAVRWNDALLPPNAALHPAADDAGVK